MTKTSFRGNEGYMAQLQNTRTQGSLISDKNLFQRENEGYMARRMTSTQGTRIKISIWLNECMAIWIC